MASESLPTIETSGKIAIVGAGSVGATIAYALMLRGLASQMVMMDTDRAKCEAQVKDLNHGLRFVPSVRIWAGTTADYARADIVVVTAGAKQKPGQTRLDLAQTNVAIFHELIPAIFSAAPETILLVVSNPVDVLTYAATKWHEGEVCRVMGSGTVLDSSRFGTLIAERIGVSVRNVHAYIVGEHGDSELPLWSNARVGYMPLNEFKAPGYRALTEKDKLEIMSQVRSAAAEIIAAKGATNWAIGLAVARIVEAILRDENALLPVSRLLENYYGISDVCLSVPCILNRSGAGQPLPVPMNQTEQDGLQASAEVVKKICDSVGL